MFDATGAYEVTFYVAGAAIATAGVICLPLRVFGKCEGTRAAIAHYNKERAITLTDGELDELAANLNIGNSNNRIPIPASLLKETTSTMSLELVGKQVSKRAMTSSKLSLAGSVSTLTGSNTHLRLGLSKQNEAVQKVCVV